MDENELKRIAVNKSNKRLFGTIALASILFGCYQSFVVPANKAKDARTQHEAFLAGYRDGWMYECDNIFNNSVGPSGVLYAGSNQYSENWCQRLFAESGANAAYKKAGGAIMAEYSSDENQKDAGWSHGATDVIDTVFSYTEYLCYGALCTSSNDEYSALASRTEPSY